MLNFPEMKEPVARSLPKMPLREYLQFCAFCLENNPHITPENCLSRDSGERDIREPFSMRGWSGDKDETDAGKPKA